MTAHISGDQETFTLDIMANGHAVGLVHAKLYPCSEHGERVGWMDGELWADYGGLVCYIPNTDADAIGRGGFELTPAKLAEWISQNAGNSPKLRDAMAKQAEHDRWDALVSDGVVGAV